MRFREDFALSGTLMLHSRLLRVPVVRNDALREMICPSPRVPHGRRWKLA